MSNNDVASIPFGPDPELREVRRRQRELLASVPDWWLDRAKRPSLDPPTHLRAGLWERRLRKLADTAIEPAVAWLDGALHGAEVEEVEQLIDAALQRAGSMDLYEVLDPSLATLRAEKASGVKVPRALNDPVIIEALHSGMILLLWADEVADDGYCDPRAVGGDSLE